MRLLPKLLQQRIAGRFNLHAAIHNSGWLLFDKLARIIIGLFVGAWVARYLGPNAYGEVAYALAYLAFFQVAVYLGLDGIIVRDISKYPTRSGEILGTALFMRMITGVISWAIAIVGLMLANGWHDQTVFLMLIAGSALVFQPADTIDLWFQSQSQSRRTVIAKLTSFFISNGVRVLLVTQNASVAWFVFVVAIDAMMSSLGLVAIYRLANFRLYWVWNFSVAKKLLRESWPYTLSSLSVMVYMRFDQILIKGMLGSKALGLYAVILPLSNVWNMIPIVICSSLAPIIARRKSESEDEYYKVLLFIFRSFLLVSLSLSVVIALLAIPIVNILYGESYVDSSSILAIHVFTNVPVFLGVAQGLWFTNEKRPGLMLRNTLIGGCVALIANYYFLPIMGVKGAAISAVLSFFTSGILLNFFGAREVFMMQLGMDPRRLK